MSLDLAKARSFIKSVDLQDTPRDMRARAQGADTGEVFEQAKNQSQLVASALFSFAQGVTADVREAISDSALLAQLVANKRFDFETKPVDWFKSYSEVLQNVGWTLQESGWSDYTARGTSAEVHQKIIEVLTVALGPAPAALAIVTAAVDALSAMNTDSPWITLFDQQSKKGRVARFQVGLVERDANADVFVSLIGCLVEAHSDITQVLFFKFRDEGATFKANTAKVSVNAADLRELVPAIRGKVRAYQSTYLSSIVDL